MLYDTTSPSLVIPQSSLSPPQPRIPPVPVPLITPPHQLSRFVVGIRMIGPVFWNALGKIYPLRVQSTTSNTSYSLQFILLVLFSLNSGRIKTRSGVLESSRQALSICSGIIPIKPSFCRSIQSKTGLESGQPIRNHIRKSGFE